MLASPNRYRKSRIPTACRLECEECLTDRPHVVNADDLHALHGKRERRHYSRVREVCLFFADEFAQETFARVADQEWAAERVEFMAVSHERDVVFVRFAEADAWIEANSL